MSDHPTHHILDSPRQPNVQHIVKYFTDAQGRYRSFREQKTWQKLHLALVDARLAVLRTKWTDLLKAVKAVSDALSFSPAGLKLEWRAPILGEIVLWGTGDLV